MNVTEITDSFEEFRTIIRNFYEPNDNVILKHIKRHIILTLCGATFFMAFLLAFMIRINPFYSIFMLISVYTLLFIIYPFTIDFYLRSRSIKKQMKEYDLKIPSLEAHVNPHLLEIGSKRTYKPYESSVFDVLDIITFLILGGVAIYNAIFFAMPIYAYAIMIYPFIRLVLFKSYLTKQIEFMDRTIVIIMNSPPSGTPPVPRYVSSTPLNLESQIPFPTIQFCSVCGSKVPRPGVRFCVKCGHDLSI